MSQLPSLNPYEIALQTPSPSFRSPTITIQPWISNNSDEFGGDIKIVENKVDMNQALKEEDLPEYLYDRYISVFAQDFDVDDTWNGMGVAIIKNEGIMEFRTQRKLFVDIWAQTEAVITRLAQLGKEPFEVRSTFHCSQSNIESLILKQILCQELSDVEDVLIIADPKFCSVRFFKKAMEPNLKKFSKRIRSTFELTELASRVHAVGLRYNRTPFPEFEKHEVVPQGLRAPENEE